MKWAFRILDLENSKLDAVSGSPAGTTIAYTEVKFGPRKLSQSLVLQSSMLGHECSLQWWGSWRSSCCTPWSSFHQSSDVFAWHGKYNKHMILKNSADDRPFLWPRCDKGCDCSFRLHCWWWSEPIWDTLYKGLPVSYRLVSTSLLWPVHKKSGSHYLEEGICTKSEEIFHGKPWNS